MSGSGRPFSPKSNDDCSPCFLYKSFFYARGQDFPFLPRGINLAGQGRRIIWPLAGSIVYLGGSIFLNLDLLTGALDQVISQQVKKKFNFFVFGHSGHGIVFNFKYFLKGTESEDLIPFLQCQTSSCVPYEETELSLTFFFISQRYLTLSLTLQTRCPHSP